MSQPVLVLGDDLEIFLAVCRSLGRRGIEVHAAPFSFASPALRSRYIAAVHRLPPYPLDSGKWEEALKRLIAAQDFRFIVPTSDSSLMMLEHHAEALGRDRLALPNRLALETFIDKAETRAIAGRVGVPTARGALLNGDERAQDLVDQLGLPLVLKPRRSHVLGSFGGKRYARIVKNVDELERALRSGDTSGSLAESFFAGTGVGVSAIARGGRLLQTYQHRRLQQAWETGPSSRRISEATDPQLLRHVEALAAATALDGVAMFEFRQTPGGAHILLEVNARLWGSLPLAIDCGADFPALLYDLFVNGKEHEQVAYSLGVTKSDWTAECWRIRETFATLPAARGFLRGALTALSAAPGLLSRRRLDSWAADDPEPFHAERRELGAALGAAIANRLPLRQLSRKRRLQAAVQQLGRRVGERPPTLLVVRDDSACGSMLAEHLLRARLETLGVATNLRSATTFPARLRSAAPSRFRSAPDGEAPALLTVEALEAADGVILFDRATEDHLRQICPGLVAPVFQLVDIAGPAMGEGAGAAPRSALEAAIYSLADTLAARLPRQPRGEKASPYSETSPAVACVRAV